MNTEAVISDTHAAAWILKSLCTNSRWYDEIRHAGKDSFEKEYHYIPLIDITQASMRFNISTLKDACYLLQENNHVDIWGDDYEPYGMLVQVSEEGVAAFENSYYGKEKRGVLRKAIGVFATVTTIVAIAIGINKSMMHKQAKNMYPDYLKIKTTDNTPKSSENTKQYI
jgi:hypothetical protein